VKKKGKKWKGNKKQTKKGKSNKKGETQNGKRANKKKKLI
jgi:hypothetical protein